MTRKPHPKFSSHDCTACWQCVEACPRHTIKRFKFFGHRHAVPRFMHCIGCNICVRTCPQGCFTART